MTCPQCGRAIPGGSPADLCPRCLMRLALAPATPRPRQLPRELIEGGVRRIAWVGLALALTAAGVFVTGALMQPGWIDPAHAPLSYSIASAGIALSGLLLAALPWLRRPAVAMNLALALEPAAGLFISLAENSVAYTGEPIRSSSSVAVWIVVFALAAPAPFSRALAAALATAAMTPAGLAAQVLLGNVPSPPAPVWAVLSTAPFLMAAASTLLGRLIYRLGAEVRAAREFGGYQLVERIPGGGMGEVWRARHHIVGREAAVKLVRPELFETGAGARLDALRRFEREAHATASLHSPHTVALYNYGLSEDGRLYYVMELLQGFDLETLVTRWGPMPAARAAAVLIQVCDSLAEAHEAGLIHRDIKPANIMLTHAGAGGDFAKVVDFGLAQPLDPADRSLHTIAGTPAYLAPEVLAGAAPEARSDLYSLGCVACWLLTGRTVFEAATAPLMMQAHLTRAPAPLSPRAPRPIPAGLEAAVMACLEKDPARRPASAREFAARLQALRIEPPWTPQDAAHWWSRAR
jgi:hypothetical protein